MVLATRPPSFVMISRILDWSCGVQLGSMNTLGTGMKFSRSSSRRTFRYISMFCMSRESYVSNTHG